MVRAVVLSVVLGCLGALVALPGESVAEPTSPPGLYIHPVDAEVVAPFDPPLTPYGPGTRGLKYDTAPGEVVRAANAGRVRFAGQVGGALHVTVEHPDGLLTSYSGVGEILVALNDEVDRGQAVATAEGVLHVGVRRDGAYIDPASVFGSERLEVRLVPEIPLDGRGWRSPGLEAAEMAWISRVELGGGSGWGLGGILRAVATGVGDAMGWVVGDLLPVLAPVVLDVLWALAPLAVGVIAGPVVAAVVFGLVIPLAMGERPPLFQLLADLDPIARMHRIAARTLEWWDHRSNCTPEGEVPPLDEGRRIAVLVAGFDSTSDGSSVARVRTDDLGYADSDVIGFSYAGGRTPDRFGETAGPLADDLDTITATSYGRDDSSTDLVRRGELLADLLTEVHQAAPGVPVDLYAHSQGGVVTHLALLELAARPGGSEIIADLGLVATLASPHGGSDLATWAVLAEEGDWRSSTVLWVADGATDTALRPSTSNVSDLARGSELLRQLDPADLPVGPTYLSVGARYDWLVLDDRSRLGQGHHVTVPVGGTTAHSTMTSHPATTRELALARGGAPPTCQGFGSFVADLAVGEALHALSSGLGAGLATFQMW